MLRAKRITPPSENSFASERISGVIVVPGRLPIRSWPMSWRMVLGTEAL
jgi:hypothetical protein